MEVKMRINYQNTYKSVGVNAFQKKSSDRYKMLEKNSLLQLPNIIIKKEKMSLLPT